MEDGVLVAGLGNPGPEHAGTRHNIGFGVVEELADRVGAIGWQGKFTAEMTRCRVDDRSVVLLKPMTYMNLSGRSVARAAGFFRFSVESILVVHDDLDLDFGMVRVKQGGGTGGHKGLSSCKQLLGSGDFSRVRVGIGRPRHGNATKFVLEKFSSDESAVLTDVIAKAADAVETTIRHGVVRAMNAFNKRGGETDDS